MTNEVEVTPEMIEAGIAELAIYGGPIETDPRLAVEWIFEAMYRAM